jgi:hypothetical protein
MQLVADDLLEVLARAYGPNSSEAAALTALRFNRSRDRQAFAFRVRESYVIGPMPDAETRLLILLVHECCACTEGRCD